MSPDTRRTATLVAAFGRSAGACRRAALVLGTLGALGACETSEAEVELNAGQADATGDALALGDALSGPDASASDTLDDLAGMPSDVEWTIDTPSGALDVWGSGDLPWMGDVDPEVWTSDTGHWGADAAPLDDVYWLPDAPGSDVIGWDDWASWGDLLEPDDIASWAETAGADADPGTPEVEDVGLPPEGPARFRLTSLHFASPPLCFGTPCLDVTAAANGILDGLFSDAEAPADVLLTLDLAMQPVPAQLGGASCARDVTGAVLGCGLDLSSPPDTFELVSMGVGGSCLGVPGKCLFTPIPLPSLAFELAGYLVGVTEAKVGLRHDGPLVIPEGILEGFLPEKTAQALAFDTGFVGVLSVAELLAEAPSDVVNGQFGWWVRLEFKAVGVPGLDATVP